MKSPRENLLRFRRWRRAYFASSAFGLAGLVAFARGDLSAFAVLFSVPMVVGVLGAVALRHFPCPHCGHQFWGALRVGWTGRAPPCPSCGCDLTRAPAA
jgi:hypothetical protein